MGSSLSTDSSGFHLSDGQTGGGVACVDQDLLWDGLLWSADDVGKPPVTADKDEKRDALLLNQLS